MGLSSLGIFHTLIGFAAVIAGLIAFVKFGKIDLSRLSGKIYFYGTLISAITALGLTKHGFNPGHVLSLLVILLVILAFYLFLKKRESSTARYWENFCLSFSFFLSMLPTVNETFTRVPLHHPIAASPKDPIIAKTLLVILVMFICGSVYQFVKQRKTNRISASQKTQSLTLDQSQTDEQNR
ncbi:hypothetical protein [Flavobacterium sp.]|uniref:hypothetical protein n=1 Tax=Flavobacterium sp. TaxID=239 RepID=UPI0011F82826|nr:hypothetical protein [Flavobacterium sp.]RZJ70561.1 MAG: hypothetical protein EOO49_13090 [Flavobacterium sp.]